MTASKKLIQAAAGAGGAGFYPYTIDNSARFNDGDSAELTRTFGAGNRKVWTWSAWVKRCALPGNFEYLFACSIDTTNYAILRFRDAHTLEFGHVVSGVLDASIISSSVYRDPSAWYHVVCSFDAANTTCRLYVNGIEVSYGTTNQPSNADGPINSANVHRICGSLPGIGGSHADAYLSQVAFVDGQALTPSSFGENKNGVWVPKNVSGLTFGTNGFYLKFGNSGALGTDSSGNGNNFTSSGLTSSDQMLDTPTSNYATWNPLDKSNSPTIAEGNLKVTGPATAQNNIRATMSMSTGKWYWEVTITTQSGYHPQIGIYGTSKPISGIDISSESTGYLIITGNSGTYYDGSPIHAGTVLSSLTTFTNGDILNVAYDADNGKLYWGKNGTWLNSADPAAGTGAVYSGLTGEYSPAMSVKDSDVSEINFGQSGFAYTPPTDFLALSTANLPEPTIGPNSTTTSDENFNTVLYTGNGSTQSVTGVGFQPDFTWVKKRSGAERHVLFDAVRGAGYQLSSDLAVAEVYLNYTLTSFDSDGFSNGNNGYTNESGHTYVAWNWKANGSGVTNTDGSITSTVSANTDAGISIVTGDFSASGTDTVGHGLGVAPDMIILKNRSLDYNWLIWHNSFTVSEYLAFTAGSKGTYSNLWGSSLPSSTVFGFSGGVYNGDTFVAYCFAEKEGFSKIGSYTGNGSTDGPYIYCGFRPAFIMTKRTDTSGYWWEIVDTAREPYNPSDQTLYANVSDSEYTSSVYDKDLLSNGFKIRGTNGGHNASGGSYIFMAFAEQPFRYSNAR
jgi:hypothetical protein